MWAVVPVKQFRLAKQRLAPVLSAPERAGLFEAMVADVLIALRETPGVTRIVLVTSEAAIAPYASWSDAQLLHDQGGDHIAAVEQGVRAAQRAEAAGVLIVPGDLPLATPESFSAVLSIHGTSSAVTIVPDTEGDGTNALVCSPPPAIDFAFGPGSRHRHAEAARRSGIVPAVMQSRDLALDVDTPNDLVELLRSDPRGHTLAFLESSGIVSRLPASGRTEGAHQAFSHVGEERA